MNWDMDDTIAEVVKGSEGPLSIIIVGIGNSRFDDMVKLDSDDELLYSSLLGRRAVSDIVQFVPFKDF